MTTIPSILDNSTPAQEGHPAPPPAWGADPHDFHCPHSIPTDESCAACLPSLQAQLAAFDAEIAAALLALAVEQQQVTRLITQSGRLLDGTDPRYPRRVKGAY